MISTTWNFYVLEYTVLLPFTRAGLHFHCNKDGPAVNFQCHD